MRRTAGKTLGVLAGALLLAACETAVPSGGSRVPQTARPPALPDPAQSAEPSAESRALAVYYQRLETDLLKQGLLRTDPGGRDTPFGARDLARNFELIAFFDEYERGAGLRASSGKPVPMRRWADPVRVNVEFGPSVAATQQQADIRNIRAYAARLARASNHPILIDAARPNMTILIYGEDDKPYLPQRARQIVPGISNGALSVFRNLPRQIHCFVMAFSGGGPDGNVYQQAIVVIRAEHPDLLRASCIHEEMAQGLGLANDTPRARPSIFNDDDEFALLTRHDELLLKMLYDPRLSPGMTLDQARPIIAEMAEELLGGSS
jgi:predicted small secreted protein